VIASLSPLRSTGAATRIPAPAAASAIRPASRREGNGRRKPTLRNLHGLLYATHEQAAPFSRRPTSPYIFVQDLGAINSRMSGRPFVMINEVYNRHILELAGNIP